LYKIKKKKRKDGGKRWLKKYFFVKYFLVGLEKECTGRREREL